MGIKHYHQSPKRNSKCITPPNTIKAKVGSGGLSDKILDRTQALLENHTVDFAPLAEIYLQQMHDGIENSKHNTEPSESEEDIAKILFPCVQLKSSGTMFHYSLVSRVSERFVQFMEVVVRLDPESIDIAEAFYNALKIIITSQIKGDGGAQGNALVEELNGACMRYFEKHKDHMENKKLD